MGADCGTVVAISTSSHKGVRKTNVEAATLVEGHGIEGDAHAGSGHRQVSLLAMESIAKMREKGLDVGPGDFAENITTSGIHIHHLRTGARVQIGEALLEITQIGKQCHSRCAIYEQAGDCVMPREGIFGRVLRGGTVSVGDAVMVELA